MSAVVKAGNLSKYYGKTPVMDNISFTIGKGAIVGLIGPNGAGKTTTLKAILGLTSCAGELDDLSVAEGVHPVKAMPERGKDMYWSMLFLQLSPLIYLVYWGVMFYYFLMTLFQQRSNRTILFWNSMPVSDTETVLSKLISGLLFCHLVYLFCWLAIQLNGWPCKQSGEYRRAEEAKPISACVDE